MLVMVAESSQSVNLRMLYFSICVRTVLGDTATIYGLRYGQVFPGDRGTMTITTYTSTRIAGTFSFTASCVPGSGTSTPQSCAARNTVTVTGGTFNITFTP